MIYAEPACRPQVERVAPKAGNSRSQTARERAKIAQEMLADCRLCAHDCGVNRLAGEMGLCHAGASARFFSAQVEVSDESELIPTFAIALSGCDLRCDFCITGASSWNARSGYGLDTVAMAMRAQSALSSGARTIMFLGGEPTIHLPSVLALVSHLPDSAKLIWKTNAHGSAQARELLDGMFNMWLADFKFGNDACAQQLAKVPDYVRVVQENLLWFAGAKPGELIIRHLVMPGHMKCCWQPIAEWLAHTLPGVKVSLGFGFWPAWHSHRHAGLRQTISLSERDQALSLAKQFDLNLIA